MDDAPSVLARILALFATGKLQRGSALLTTYWSESTIVMIRWTGLAPWKFD